MEASESLSELAGFVRITESIYPSIRERNWNPQPLIDALVRGAETSEDIQRKRLFLNALSAGGEDFPEAVNLGLSSINLDLLSRQKVELSMIGESENL